eukprot:748670-Hanusia_phi.AAC.6
MILNQPKTPLNHTSLLFSCNLPTEKYTFSLMNRLSMTGCIINTCDVGPVGKERARVPLPHSPQPSPPMDIVPRCCDREVDLHQLLRSHRHHVVPHIPPLPQKARPQRHDPTEDSAALGEVDSSYPELKGQGRDRKLACRNEITGRRGDDETVDSDGLIEREPGQS